MLQFKNFVPGVEEPSYWEVGFSNMTQGEIVRIKPWKDQATQEKSQDSLEWRLLTDFDFVGNFHTTPTPQGFLLTSFEGSLSFDVSDATMMVWCKKGLVSDLRVLTQKAILVGMFRMKPPFLIDKVA